MPLPFDRRHHRAFSVRRRRRIGSAKPRHLRERHFGRAMFLRHVNLALVPKLADFDHRRIKQLVINAYQIAQGPEDALRERRSALGIPEDERARTYDLMRPPGCFSLPPPFVDYVLYTRCI